MFDRHGFYQHPWEERVEPVFALKFTQKIAILSYQIYIAAITFVQGKLAGYVQLNMREFRKGTTTYLDSSDEQGVKILAKWNSNACKLKLKPHGKISVYVPAWLCIQLLFWRNNKSSNAWPLGATGFVSRPI